MVERCQNWIPDPNRADIPTSFRSSYVGASLQRALPPTLTVINNAHSNHSIAKHARARFLSLSNIQITHSLLLFFLLHFLIHFLNPLLHFFPIIRMRHHIQISLIRLDRLLLQSLFLLRFAQKTKGNCKSRLRGSGILKTIHRRIQITLPHVVLPNFQIFLRSQWIPRRLIGSRLRRIVRIFLRWSLLRRRWLVRRPLGSGLRPRLRIL